MTAGGVILGTAAYVSPEQTKGKIVDRRADIWAFGVVLYEMLTGGLLFGGDTVSETMARVILKEPDWEHVVAVEPPGVDTSRVREDPKIVLQAFRDHVEVPPGFFRLSPDLGFERDKTAVNRFEPAVHRLEMAIHASKTAVHRPFQLGERHRCPAASHHGIVGLATTMPDGCGKRMGLNRPEIRRTIDARADSAIGLSVPRGSLKQRDFPKRGGAGTMTSLCKRPCAATEVGWIRPSGAESASISSCAA